MRHGVVVGWLFATIVMLIFLTAADVAATTVDCSPRRPRSRIVGDQGDAAGRANPRLLGSRPPPKIARDAAPPGAAERSFQARTNAHALEATTMPVTLYAKCSSCIQINAPAQKIEAQADWLMFLSVVLLACWETRSRLGRHGRTRLLWTRAAPQRRSVPRTRRSPSRGQRRRDRHASPHPACALPIPWLSRRWTEVPPKLSGLTAPGVTDMPVSRCCPCSQCSPQRSESDSPGRRCCR
jgi:hypothetical protein